MKQLFSIFIIAIRAARDVCLDDFYQVGNTECFEMSFPWVTFPEKYWPMIRVFSEPMPLNEINITLHIYHENDFIQISNKTEFEDFYNHEQVTRQRNILKLMLVTDTRVSFGDKFDTSGFILIQPQT